MIVVILLLLFVTIIILFLNSLPAWMTDMSSAVLPGILLVLSPFSLEDFSVCLWTGVSALRLRDPLYPEHPRNKSHTNPGTERTLSLEAQAGHGFLFCSSSESLPLCQIHVWGEQDRSVGIRSGRSLSSQCGSSRGSARRPSRCTPSPLEDCGCAPLLSSCPANSPLCLPDAEEAWKPRYQVMLCPGHLNMSLKSSRTVTCPRS